MSDTLTAPQLFSIEEFLSSDNLQKVDETLTEVFAVMLGFEIQPVEEVDATDLPGDAIADRVTAFIGFTGVARGSCEVSMSCAAALVIATAMMGGAPEEDEAAAATRDAASEICNLVAGGWKLRVDSLQSRLLLAPPAVMTGKNYRVYAVDSSASIHRTYSFDGNPLMLTLRIERE